VVKGQESSKRVIVAGTRFRRPKGNIDLQLYGFETLQNMLTGSEFEMHLNINIRQANKILSTLGSTRLVKEIRDGKHAPNSPVTIYLKGSAKPLIDHGDLFGSVSGKLTSDSYGFVVGVKRRTVGGNNLAHMLETGFTIKVTPKMRKFFFAKARESGGRFKALNASTTHLRVPSRSYMQQAFFDEKDFQLLVAQKWKNAVHKTFKFFADRAKRTGK
jgi:hypothetical protein